MQGPLVEGRGGLRRRESGRRRAASMQGPLVEGRGRRALGVERVPQLAASMQGPLVEGRGRAAELREHGAVGRLQCRALSSRAGAGPPSSASTARLVGFNAGPSRRGPGPLRGPVSRVRRHALQCRALSSRAGARARLDPGEDAARDASMQGPLVEGRGSRWATSVPVRSGGFNAGPSRRGPGQRSRRAAARRGGARFNAGPSRRGPGPAIHLWPRAVALLGLQCRALSSRAGAPRSAATGGALRLFQCRALSSRAGAPRLPSAAASIMPLQCRALSSRAGALNGPSIRDVSEALQCRALSSRAGASPSTPGARRRRRSFNAGPSRRGPGRALRPRRSRCRCSCFNAGPSRRGPGPGLTSHHGSHTRRLQCRALSSRAGARPRRYPDPATAPSFNAGPSRRGPGPRPAPAGQVRPHRASMQGPLVEGRGGSLR